MPGERQPNNSSIIKLICPRGWAATLEDLIRRRPRQEKNLQGSSALTADLPTERVGRAQMPIELNSADCNASFDKWASPVWGVL